MTSISLRARHRPALAGLALTLASMSASTIASEAALVVDIYLDRSTVLAFVPAMPADDGGDPAVARAAAAQALALAGACLGRRPVLYQLVVADHIVLHDGERAVDVDVAAMAPLTGIVLAAPKRNPSVVFAGGGPESLATIVPLAASNFFHQTCKP